MQACCAGHSEFMVHSGLQFGGWPINVGKQEHAGTAPLLRHSEFGPHGEGTQGSLISSRSISGGGAKKKLSNLFPTNTWEVKLYCLRGIR